MPNTGKKLKMPPRISNKAAASRAANDEGLRNQRMNSETLVGTRRLIISKYLFSSAFVAAIFFLCCFPSQGLSGETTTPLHVEVPLSRRVFDRSPHVRNLSATNEAIRKRMGPKNSSSEYAKGSLKSAGALLADNDEWLRIVAAADTGGKASPANLRISISAGSDYGRGAGRTAFRAG
jgi:hypothetical protein